MEPADAADADALLAEIGWIRALALQLVRDVAAADDLVQETLLAALERRPNESGGLRPWLGTVVRRRAALAKRGDQRRRAREEREARAEALPSAEELAARAQVQRALVEAVLALSEPYRSAVLLRYFEGLSPQEIARRRGIPDATVRSHLARGLAELRVTLDHRHHGESQSWCLALIPLAAERAGLKGAVASSLSAILGVLVMNTGVQVAVGAVLIALLSLLFLPSVPNATPASLSFAGSTASEPRRGTGTPREFDGSSSSAEREAAASPPLLVARRTAFAGRIVDHSGAPLAGYALSVRNEDGSVEDLVSDKDGHFVSERQREAGTLSIRLQDVAGRRPSWSVNSHTFAWRAREWRTHPWDGEHEVEFRDELTQSFLLRFEPPVGLTHSDFEAELFSHDPRSAPAAGMNFSQRACVRVADEPFVRFSTMMGITSNEPGRLTLRLESGDGLWVGQTAVPTCANPCTEPLEIGLEPAASLRLEFAHELGAVLEQPKLTLESLATGRMVRRAPHAFSGDPLSIELRGLDPGDYRVTVRARGVQPYEATLVLAAGKRHEEHVLIKPLADVAHVRGELTSRSGRFDIGVTLTLTGSDGERYKARPTWIVRDGSLVAPFEFEGLAPGQYAFALKAETSRNLSWSPNVGAVQAPTDDLVLECDDNASMQRVRLQVHDAATGGVVPELTITASVGKHELSPEQSWASESVYLVYEGAQLRWSVSAPGFVTASGDSNALVASGDELLQVVELERAP